MFARAPGLSPAICFDSDHDSTYSPTSSAGFAATIAVVRLCQLDDSFLGHKVDDRCAVGLFGEHGEFHNPTPSLRESATAATAPARLRKSSMLRCDPRVATTRRRRVIERRPCSDLCAPAYGFGRAVVTSATTLLASGRGRFAATYVNRVHQRLTLLRPGSSAAAAGAATAPWGGGAALGR
jgi:hypothetical protein